MDLTICSVPRCERRRFTRLHCAMHHARLRRTGAVGPADTLVVSAIERFRSKIRVTENGCHEWTGGRSRDGYGKFYEGDRLHLAHRWSWQQANGAVPSPLELDHLCRNRACVNPAHLEPVTRRTNVLRGIGITAQNAAKTACPKGHPYAGANLYVNPAGGRVCRECQRQKAAAYRARQRGAA